MEPSSLGAKRCSQYVLRSDDRRKNCLDDTYGPRRNRFRSGAYFKISSESPKDIPVFEHRWIGSRSVQKRFRGIFAYIFPDSWNIWFTLYVPIQADESSKNVGHGLFGSQQLILEYHHEERISHLSAPSELRFAGHLAEPWPLSVRGASRRQDFEVLLTVLTSEQAGPGVFDFRAAPMGRIDVCFDAACLLAYNRGGEEQARLERSSTESKVRVVLPLQLWFHFLWDFYNSPLLFRSYGASVVRGGPRQDSDILGYHGETEVDSSLWYKLESSLDNDKLVRALRAYLEYQVVAAHMSWRWPPVSSLSPAEPSWKLVENIAKCATNIEFELVSGENHGPYPPITFDPLEWLDAALLWARYLSLAYQEPLFEHPNSPFYLYRYSLPEHSIRILQHIGVLVLVASNGSCWRTSWSSSDELEWRRKVQLLPRLIQTTQTLRWFADWMQHFGLSKGKRFVADMAECVGDLMGQV